MYWPIGSELRLDDFIQTALQRGARVYLPYIEPGRLRLWFTPYCADAAQAERARGRLKIPQFHGEKIRAHRLNTLLLPLVGIDSEGYRLGRFGYMEVLDARRTLAAVSAQLVRAQAEMHRAFADLSRLRGEGMNDLTMGEQQK